MICTKSCNLLLDDLAQSIFYLEWRTFGLDLDFDFGGFCLRLLDCHVISELVQAEGIEPPILQRASGLQPDERHRSRPANWRSVQDFNPRMPGSLTFTGFQDQRLSTRPTLQRPIYGSLTYLRTPVWVKL